MARTRNSLSDESVEDAEPLTVETPSPSASPPGARTGDAPVRLRDPEPVDYGILSGLPAFWVRRANLLVLKSFGEHLKDFDLRPVEVVTLALLEENRGLSQIALAEALGTDQSTMVSLLNRLQKRKLISRTRMAADRRVRIVKLSAEGRSSFDLIKRQIQAHNDSVFGALSHGERATLIELLKRTIGQ